MSMLLRSTHSVCLRCQAKGPKVNERGKISSRPGPVSPKEAKKRAEQARKEQTEVQSAADLSPSGSIPSTSAVAAPQPPAASTSQPAAPSQPAYNVQGVGTTPQVVVDRIFKRMVTCAGLPIALGLVLLVVFAVLKRQGGDDFPVWPAYVSNGITFAGGLFGITYGALSASWDPTREGSVLGWTEFQANLPIFLKSGKQQQ